MASNTARVACLLPACWLLAAAPAPAEPQELASLRAEASDEEMARFFERLHRSGACGQRGAPCVGVIRRIRGTHDRGARYLIARYEDGSFTHPSLFEYLAHTGSPVANAWLRSKAHETLDWRPGDAWPTHDPAAKRRIVDRRWAILALGWIDDESAVDDLLRLLDSPELSETGRLHAAKALKHKLLYGDLGDDPASARPLSPARREAALARLGELAAADSGPDSRLRRSARSIVACAEASAPPAGAGPSAARAATGSPSAPSAGCGR